MNKKDRIWGGWKRCVWGVGILAVSLILIWVILDIAGGIKLRGAIAAWKEAGHPMDFREAIPEPVPKEENAAVILNHVIPFSYPEWPQTRLIDDRLRRTEEEAVAMGEELFARLAAGEASPDLIMELEKALQDPVIAFKREIARRAVEYERFDAYLEYDLGWDLTIPHAGPMRRLGRILQAEAVLNAAEGRWPEAYDALLVSVQLGDLLSDEPIMISQIVRRDLHREALERLEIFLRREPPGDDGSRRLRRNFFEGEKAELLRVTKVEGIWITLHLYRVFERGDFTPSHVLDSHGVSYSWLDTWIFRPMHKADVAAFMDVTRQRLLTLGSGADGFDYHRILSDLARDFTSGLPPYAPVTQRVFPEPSKTWFLRETQTITRLALARAALAAHAYRAAGNDWPRTLEDLVPEYLPAVPEDPFGDGLLRFERGGGRVVLYSIGPDRTDDGGQPMDNVDPDAPGDVVWVLEGESL